MDAKSFWSIALALGLLAILSLNMYLTKKVLKLEARSFKISYDVTDDKIGQNVEKLDNPPSDIQLAGAISPSRGRRSTPRKKTRSKKRSHFGCHLLGLSGQDFSTSDRDYILWERPSSAHPAVCFFNLVSDEKNHTIYRQIIIPKNGYYLAYAQMTLNGMGATVVGFKTVLIDDDMGEKDLLSTMIKQDEVRDLSSTQKYQDSGYHSGYFNLKAGQKLEVRQFNINVSVFMYRPDTCYFGVVFMDKEYYH